MRVCVGDGVRVCVGGGVWNDDVKGVCGNCAKV